MWWAWLRYGSYRQDLTRSVIKEAKTGDRFVAVVVEFYVPNNFRKPVRWTPPAQRGKVIDFPLVKKSA
jgi:hypothetical protein